MDEQVKLEAERDRLQREKSRLQFLLLHRHSHHETPLTMEEIDHLDAARFAALKGNEL